VLTYEISLLLFDEILVRSRFPLEMSHHQRGSLINSRVIGPGAYAATSASLSQRAVTPPRRQLNLLLVTCWRSAVFQKI
jgi:hypothetical protein